MRRGELSVQCPWMTVFTVIAIDKELMAYVSPHTRVPNPLSPYINKVRGRARASCTTTLFSVYVTLSKNDSHMLLKPRGIAQSRPAKRPVFKSECKGTEFLQYHQTFSGLF